jgi:cation diffusion facilitator family transporter
MSKDDHNQASRQIKSVTYLSIAANIALFLIKVIVGLIGGSVSLVADGIHSLSDLSTDGAVLLGHHFGSKEPDREHPYGHGRIETLSTVVIALILIVVGCLMVRYAGLDIARGKVSEASTAVMIAALVSVFGKEALYRITRVAAVKSNSSALYANAWHHRSDALSSVAVVGGFLTLRFGFSYGDQVAAIVVGLMVMMVGVHILSDCLREFTETAIDKKSIDKIKGIINAEPDVKDWHKLRTRTVGREVFLDLHILVDPELNVTAAHEISTRLEKSIEEGLRRPVNIVVHIEPDLPELRV